MKQIEAQGTALHKHRQAQEVSETCSQLAPLDTSGVFGTETRAPAHPWAALIWSYLSDYALLQKAEGLSSVFYL